MTSLSQSGVLLNSTKSKGLIGSLGVVLGIDDRPQRGVEYIYMNANCPGPFLMFWPKKANFVLRRQR